MNPSNYAVVFKLLDDYSRNKHQSFVAEFFLNRAKTEYYACFRPTGGTKDSPNRYACRYLHMGIIEVTEAAKRKELPDSVIELLDKELPALGGLV